MNRNRVQQLALVFVALLAAFALNAAAAPPSLSVEDLPESTNEGVITASGTSDPQMTIKSYIGGVLSSFTIAGEDGVWQDDLALREGPNQLVIRAVNDAGEKTERAFEIRKDTRPPIIVLNNFNPVIIDDKILLNISLDENSSVKVFVNDNAAHTFRQTNVNFTTELTIRSEDEVEVRIEAEDLVGNKNIRVENVKKVGPPELNLTYPNLQRTSGQAGPATGRTIPTSRSDHVLEGTATPFADVYVWVYERSEAKPEQASYHTKADYNGKWQVEISLKRVVVETDDDPYDYPGGYGYGDDDEDIIGHQGIVSTIQNVENIVEIQARDEYERETNVLKFTFKLTSCGTGQSFEVPAMLAGDEHSLKPYRLRDGTEVVTFQIPLDYIGYGELDFVQKVWLKVQPLTQEMLSDPSYDCITKGRVFPNGPEKVIPGGPDKKYWYLMYNLKPWQGLNDSKIMDYKKDFLDSLHNTCKIPLVLYVSYKLKDNPTTYTEEYCVETERFIDSELDPRSVLPEWLMETSLSTLDFLIDSIETAEGPVKFSLDWSRRGCLVALGYYIYTKIDARTACTAGISVNPADMASTIAGAGDVGALVDKCNKKIEAEKKAYDYYRSVCDRVFCKDVPVRPDPNKPKKTEPANIVSTGTNAPLSCEDNEFYTCIRPVPSLGVNAIDTFNSLVENRCAPDSRWEGVVPGCQDEMTAPGGTVVKSICCLKRNANNVLTTVENVDEIKGSDWNINNAASWVESKYETYNVPKVPYNGFEKVEYSSSDTDKVLFGTTEVDAWDYGMYAGYITDRLSDYYEKNNLNEADVLINEPLLGPLSLIPGAQVKNIIRLRLLNSAQIFKERTDSGRPYYTQNIDVSYVDGLHYSQCFGQTGVWFDDDALFFQPRQNWQSSLQCGCISDIYGRMQQYKNVLVEMRNCLSQINMTGTASAGACKEMFARHVCDLFSWILVKAVLEQKNPANTDYSQQSQMVDVSNLEAFSMGFSDAWSQFTTDYGESIGGAYMLSLQGVTRQVCMGALFNEWDPGFIAAFSGDRRGAARQSSVLVYPAKRELLAANPISGTPIMEYQVGVWFSAGSDLRWIRIELVCDDEGDCPGEERVALMRFAGGGSDNSGIFREVSRNSVLTPGGYMQTRDANFRFNKVRVRWKSQEGAHFDGEEEFDFEQQEMLSLFECEVRPSGTLTGNDIISCETLTDNSYASWVTQPPAEVLVNVRAENTQPVNFRYAFRVNYGALSSQDSTGMGFMIKELKSDGSDGATRLPPTPLSDGLHTQDEFSQAVTFGSRDFGEQAPIIEGGVRPGQRGQNSGTYPCDHVLLEGQASAQGSVTIQAHYTGNLKSTEFNKPFELERNRQSGFSVTPERSAYLVDHSDYDFVAEKYVPVMEPITVEFNGVKVRFTGLKNGETCTIRTTTGEDEALKRMKFSLVYLRDGTDIIDIVRNDMGEAMERTVVFRLRNLMRGASEELIEGEITNFRISGEYANVITTNSTKNQVSFAYSGGDFAEVVFYKPSGGIQDRTGALTRVPAQNLYTGTWQVDQIPFGTYRAKAIVTEGQDKKESNDIFVYVGEACSGTDAEGADVAKAACVKNSVSCSALSSPSDCTSERPKCCHVSGTE